MICRMCLVHCQEHIRIFECEGLQLGIAAIIAKYFWFEPKVDDLVSNSVCKPCWAQISSFHSYYSHIEEAHRKLSETCFVKEEVTFDYESEEGRAENMQDMDTLPSTSNIWYDELIDEKGTSSSSSTPKTVVDVKMSDGPTTRGRPSGKRLFEEPFFAEVPTPDDPNQHNSMRTISARCLICKNKIIKGQRNVSSNFIKHLKVMHPEMYELYRSNKIIRNENCSSSFEPYHDNKNLKREKYSDPYEAQIKPENYITSTSKLNDNIIAFIADALLPLSIVENPHFVKIFEEFGVQIMGRETFNARLNDNFNVLMNRIKDAISKNKYFCTTADVWFYNKSSFFGYTCHWIDEDFNRFSAALACRRNTGQYTIDSIRELIFETNENFGLNIQNIVATMTDNGSNLTQAYMLNGLGAAPAEAKNGLINLSTDDIALPEFLKFEEHQDLINLLPKRCQSASQALGLIPTVDFTKDLENNAPLYKMHLQSFMKCLQLWDKAASNSKLKKIIITTLGTAPSYPLIIGWNSIFDGVNNILLHKDKLPELFDKLKLTNFSQSELEYLEEYCLIMWPISECINFLQGEKAKFYGYLIPSLVTLKVKLDKISCNGNLKFLNNELIALRAHLLRRFEHIFELREEAHDAVVASVTCPSIKFRWINVIGKTSNKSFEDVKNIVLQYANQISGKPQGNIVQEKMEEQDVSYFDFGDEDSATDNTSSINLSTVEWELLSYTTDKDSDFEVLRKYPNLMKLFIKYNTLLPSSTPVEKLFSFCEIINAPHKNLLSDEIFEKLALLKANMKPALCTSGTIWCRKELSKSYTVAPYNLRNNDQQIVKITGEASESPVGVYRMPKAQSHYIKKTSEFQGQKITRNRCRRCYELLVKEKGSAVAKSQTRRVSTFCETCPDRPFLCLECFKPFHEKALTADGTSQEVNVGTVIQFGNGAKWSSVEAQTFGKKEVVEQPVQNKKRGPGRPRKCGEVPTAVVEEIKSSGKRKKGRPRKRRRKGMIGRSPGRPKKIRPKVETSETNEQNSIKPRRSRGRPRKDEKLDKSGSEGCSVVEDVIRSDRLRRKTQVIDYCEKRKKLPKIVKPKREIKPDAPLSKSKQADEHIAKHMKLKCDNCAAEFITFSKLIAHYRVSHRSRGFVICCHKKFYKRILLLEHINRHLNPDYFKCDLCGKTFADSQCLKGHMMLIHEPDELKVHKCDKCHRSYSKLYLLEKHKLIHVPMEEREYICEDCGKAFATRNYLSSHVRSVHENAYGIICHICGKVIQGKTLLKKHQLEHAGIFEPKLQCRECGSWLKNKYSLKKHMDRHVERHEELKNPQKNICNTCGKVAPSKAALRSHIKYVHMSTRIHECTICMKSFKKALTLKEHMTTHTGEILYTCPYCPKTFNSSANMHSHKKKKHRADWEEDRRKRELEKERFRYDQEENSGDFDSSGQLPVEVVYDHTDAKSDSSVDIVCIK